MTTKKSISVRLMLSDQRRLKAIAGRLGVKESEVFRFSIRCMMNQLMPILDTDVRGPAMLLALLDCGEELLRYFEFDVQQISRIVNDPGESDSVDIEDIRLVAIAHVNPGYLAIKLSEVLEQEVSSAQAYGALRDYLHAKHGSELSASRMRMAEA